MKIPDDLRRTLTDVTEKVLEKGQQFGKEAQLQVQLRKLQVEHAKKIHELGKHTYDWYRSGTMIVSGPVPADVVDLCSQLDATQSQIDVTQNEMEAARHQSSHSSLNVSSTLTRSTPSTPTTPSTLSTAAASSSAPALGSPSPGATQPLDDSAAP